MFYEKLFTSFLTTGFLMASLAIPAFASQKEISKPKADDKVFQVFDEISKKREQGKITKDQIDELIEEAGWIVKTKKTLKLNRQGEVIKEGEFSTLELEPSDLTLDLFVTYNDRYRNQWAVYVDWEWDIDEDYPASYDVLGINWDPDEFYYRTRKADDEDLVWLMDASQASNGTILFNVKEPTSFLSPWSGSTWVGLNQENFPDSDETSVSMKYTHTFDKTESSESFTGSAGIDWGGAVSLGVSYTVTTTTVEDNWSKAAITDAFELN